MIERILQLNLSEDHSPVGYELQQQIESILTDETLEDATGDSPLVTALALSLINLEMRLIDTRAELNLTRTALVNLEIRLREAGFSFEFAAPEDRLDPLV